ncbi:MAG: aquaporin [Coxiellaceae bacterium]|nr:aquaporin [Coxiellaceae bacterium]|tara:strand:- start:1827 stop:2561 length:735 start_codon:yes stop_codon:yes gene_type:complete
MTHVLLGEFLGTLILIIFGGGVVANVVLHKSKGEQSGWIVIATGWFVAVCLGVFVAQAAGAEGAEINPAVTLAKFLLGYWPFITVIKIIVAQTLGAFCGAIIVWLTYFPHWAITDDQSAKLQVFCTQPAIRHTPANVFCEVLGTTVLVFCVGAIFGQANMHHPTSGLGPYLVGVIVWGIGLSLGGPTGYAINPARDFGPRLAHAILPIAGKGDSDWGYAWIPIISPCIGGVIGAIAWRSVFGIS